MDGIDAFPNLSVTPSRRSHRPEDRASSVFDVFTFGILQDL